MRIKVLFWFCAILLVVSPVLAEEHLSVSVPPSIWAQQQGNTLTGPIIDLLDDIFEPYNITIAPRVLPWARAIAQMKSGDLDMIPVIFYSRERSEYMAFTIPYIEVPTAVFVPPGRSFDFSSLDDLKGKRGVKMRGDMISPEFERYKSKLNLLDVSNYEQMLRMLGDNRVEYAVAAQYGFLIEARKLGLEQGFELLPRPVSTRQLHIAFSKKSRFLGHLPAVDKKIKHLQRDGSLAKMVENAIRLAASR